MKQLQSQLRFRQLFTAEYEIEHLQVKIGRIDNFLLHSASRRSFTSEVNESIGSQSSKDTNIMYTLNILNRKNIILILH